MEILATNSLNFPFKCLLFHLHPRGALLLNIEFYIDKCLSVLSDIVPCLLVSTVSDKSLIS